MKRMIRFVRERKGVAAVEFALVVPVVILLIAGSIELGRAVMVQHILEETARTGCRVLSMQSETRRYALDITSTNYRSRSRSAYQDWLHGRRLA